MGRKYESKKERKTYMRGLVGMKSRRDMLKRSLLGSAQWYAGDSPGTLTRSTDCIVSTVTICWLGIRSADRASGSKSKAVQRKRMVCMENAVENLEMGKSKWRSVVDGRSEIHNDMVGFIVYSNDWLLLVLTRCCDTIARHHRKNLKVR